MKAFLFSALCLFINFSFYAQSPITLSNSNMPGSGDTLRYSNAKLNALGNYTQTGTNFTWNFSTLEPTSQGVRSFKAAFQTPYAFFFFGINEYGEKIADTVGAGPIVMTKYYNYYKKQSSPVNAFIADGVGITFSSVPIPSYYSDKDELYHFPMTYPKYDSTSFKFSTATNTNVPFKYIKTGYRVTTVDGWGSVITPSGTATCLRLITTQYSIDSIKYNAGPFSFGFPNNQRSYQWLTLGDKIPYLEISGTLAGNSFTPTQAKFRDFPRTIVGIKEQEDVSGMSMYPNPVKDILYLNFKGNEKYNIEISGINGQLISAEAIEPINTGFRGINVAGLQQGLYIIKVNQNTNNYYFKFIKE